MSARGRTAGLLLLAAGVLWGLSACALSAPRPALAEENLYLLSARSILLSGTPAIPSVPDLTHPPLYIYAIALFMRAAGPGPASLYLLGGASFLAATVLLFLTIRSLLRILALPAPDVWAGAGAFAYATLPVAHRAIRVADRDTAILPPAMLLLALWLMREARPPRVRGAAIVTAALIALLFWIKETTGLALAAACVVHFAVDRRAGRGLAVAAGGFVLFAATWALYCAALDLDAVSILAHTIRQFAAHSPGGGGGLAETALGALKLAAWFSIPFLALAAVGAGRSLARDLSPDAPFRGDAFIHVSTLLLFAGYVFVGGIYYGFPRYHAPAVPFAIAGIVVLLARETEALRPDQRGARRLAAAAVLAAGILCAIGYDPVYAVTHRLKEAAIAGGGGTAGVLAEIALLTLVLPAALVGAAFLLLRRWSPRPAGRPLVLGLAAAALVLSAALGLRQAGADYYTDYCYGERGGNETIRTLAGFRRTSGLRILAANDILHNAGIPESEYRKDRFWNDPAEVAAALRDPATGALVLAIGHTAASQYAALLGDPAVAGALRSGFTLRPVGSYSVWIRRDAGPAAP